MIVSWFILADVPHPLIRAVLKKIPRKDHKEIATLLKESLGDQRRLQECIGEIESKGYSRAADSLDRFQFDLNKYQSFPHDHWKRIRTTNLLERVNKKLKRRSHSIGAFPNDPALLRLAGSSSWILTKNGSCVEGIYLTSLRYPLRIQELNLQLI